MNPIDKLEKIYIAGHRGLVGSAISKKLAAKGYTNLVHRTHAELDLINQSEVEDFFKVERPDYIILAAAKVGGIHANTTYRADFIYKNLQIQNNIIHQSYLNGVKKLLFLGSTCIYPKQAVQPMAETSLLASPLEYSNEPYAIAKIAGMKMCESYNLQYGTNFIAAMPTNVYGPNDNFDLKTSHVIPALIRKIHAAKINNRAQVEVWGSGKPRRDFLYSEDLADACIFLMENVDFQDMCSTGHKDIRNTHINIGTGTDISIEELAHLIKNTVGYNGRLYFNVNKSDGTMVKLTNIDRMRNFGWRHSIELEEGMQRTYRWYENHGISTDTP